MKGTGKTGGKEGDVQDTNVTFPRGYESRVTDERNKLQMAPGGGGGGALMAYNKSMLLLLLLNLRQILRRSPTRSLSYCV